MTRGCGPRPFCPRLLCPRQFRPVCSAPVGIAFVPGRTERKDTSVDTEYLGPRFAPHTYVGTHRQPDLCVHSPLSALLSRPSFLRWPLASRKPKALPVLRTR
jgi:hypothetical protein